MTTISSTAEIIADLCAGRMVILVDEEERENEGDLLMAAEDFVLFERDTPTRKATDKILKSNGVEVKKVAEFDNIETIKRGVEVGFGLAIVPLPSVIEEERNSQLAVIKLAEKEWVRPVGVIYRSDRNISLAAKKFVQLLETNSQGFTDPPE